MLGYIRKTSLHDTTITLQRDPEGIVLHVKNRIALNSECNDLYTLIHLYTVTEGLKNEVGPTCKAKMQRLHRRSYSVTLVQRNQGSFDLILGDNVNVIGQTAFRDHVREYHDRHSRLGTNYRPHTKII